MSGRRYVRSSSAGVNKDLSGVVCGWSMRLSGAEQGKNAP